MSLSEEKKKKGRQINFYDQYNKIASNTIHKKISTLHVVPCIAYRYSRLLSLRSIEQWKLQ